MTRRIAHIDMDAFFASVELLRYPQLKDLPVVIGGRDVGFAHTHDAPGSIPLDAFPRLASYVGRGVITTATYPARAFGVGSAMGMMKAARLCPQAILLPVDFARYRDFSRRFKRAVLGEVSVMEDRGIDEVYADFTQVPGGQDLGGRLLAERVQRAVWDATGLTCSIGVAPNKLLAKLASEFNKPRGITILLPEDLRTRIWPLACRKVNGIGPKLDAKLAAHGIHTVGDLAGREPAWLVEQFGKSHGAWLHAVAWGRDERPVVTQSEPVSLSRETTFERDLHARHDKAELGAIFTTLCEQVAADLRRKGYAGKTIGVKLRYGDFKIATRDQTLNHHTQDAAEIRRVAGKCLTRVDLTRRFRLLGVRVGSLVPLAQAQAPAPARAPAATLALF